MFCKTCSSPVKKHPYAYEKLRNNLWLAKCTNPNHFHSLYVSYQFIGGGWFLRPAKMKKPKKESYTSGDYTHYWDGQREQKIKTTKLDSIQSRAVLPDGSILTGEKGIKYNKARGAKYGNQKVIGL